MAAALLPYIRKSEEGLTVHCVCHVSLVTDSDSFSSSGSMLKAVGSTYVQLVSSFSSTSDRSRGMSESNRITPAELMLAL